MPLPLLAPLVVSAIVAAGVQILLALGIGFVSYTVALPAFYAFLTSLFTGLPPEIFQIVGILRVDIAITMMLSALAAKLSYSFSMTALSKVRT